MFKQLWPKQHDEKLIPTVIRAALNGSPIPVYGDGLNIRDWLYVADRCNAIGLVYQSGEPGDTYNTGGSNELTNRQVVDKICSILDRKVPLQNKCYRDLVCFVRDLAGHDRRYAIDATKIETNLGWIAVDLSIRVL